MTARRPFPEGRGFFETLRTENGEVAELGRHMRRALTASRATGIPMPDEEVLRLEIKAAMELEPHAVGRLRICFKEDGFVVTHDSYEEIESLARLTFHSTTSKAEGEQFKTFPYESRYEILDQARGLGFDDAILFNKSNEVTETALSNVVLKIDSRWITPPISAGILPGIMRALAIERCGVDVAPIHISQIPNVESAFLLSSLKIAQPVSRIGDFALRFTESESAFEAQMRAEVQYFSVV